MQGWMDTGKGPERGVVGGVIRVWELGREMRPKPEQVLSVLSELQTDPKSPEPPK